MVKYIPERGHVVWLDFNPQSGREIMKTRPALVVSPKKYNEKSGLALFMPITSKVKGYPFEELVNTGTLDGALLCDQIRLLDWQVRNARYLCTLSEEKVSNAIEKFSLLLS